MCVIPVVGTARVVVGTARVVVGTARVVVGIVVGIVADGFGNALYRTSSGFVVAHLATIRRWRRIPCCTCCGGIVFLLLLLHHHHGGLWRSLLLLYPIIFLLYDEC